MDIEELSLDGLSLAEPPANEPAALDKGSARFLAACTIGTRRVQLRADAPPSIDAPPSFTPVGGNAGHNGNGTGAAAGAEDVLRTHLAQLKEADVAELMRLAREEGASGMRARLQSFGVTKLGERLRIEQALKSYAYACRPSVSDEGPELIPTD